jgi:hypothetical protein
MALTKKRMMMMAKMKHSSTPVGPPGWAQLAMSPKCHSRSVITKTVEWKLKSRRERRRKSKGQNQKSQAKEDSKRNCGRKCA